MINAEASERIKEIIVSIIRKMGIEADIEIREQPDTTVFNIRTNDSNMLIGQYGVNLNALQYVCRVLARRQGVGDVDFVLDVDDYKKKRESYLVNLAKSAYKEAVSSGKTVAIKPLTAFERRVVHSALSEMPDVASDSIGEEPNRMVTVRPKDAPLPTAPQDLNFGDNEYKIIE